MACPCGSEARTGWGKEDEWGDLLADVPREEQSHRPGPPLPRLHELLAGNPRNPQHQSWRGARGDQLVQPPRFTDDNYHDYAGWWQFTKGFHIWVASARQSPWGWQSSSGSFYAPPYFVTEETKA